MKKFFSSILALLLVSVNMVPSTFSATTNATRIEIVAPTTARVGEAIDVTLRAVDKDNKTVTNYLGSVIFNTDNIGDTIPAPGKTVTFTANDNGEKKFSKGIVFKKSGKQKIYVYDVSDEIQGEVTVTVDAEWATTTTNDQTITIITPETGTKITADMVVVSGKTRKNSKVNIKLNGQDMGSPALSDDIGIFTKNISGITQESNILVAELIDGTNTVVAKSAEVKFGKVTTTTSTYGLTIMPSSTVEASSPIEITVDATPGLSELSVSIDGSVLVAKEGTAGKYTLQTVAPMKAGVYKLPISQKDALGQVKTAESTTVLTVTEKVVVVVPPTPVPVPTFKNVKTVTTGSKIVFDFWVENAGADLSWFKIAYGPNADALNQEVVTLPLNRIPSQLVPGGYTWYVDKIPEGTYTFKIFGRTQEWSLISGFASEPIVATIGKDSCTIGNVAWLMVTTDDDKSIISWAALTGATSYNIYKVSAAWDYALFQNTKEPTYTINLAKGDVVYENFVVKAKCDDTTESKEYSSMSKVQTGPGIVAILVILSAIAWAFLMRRRYI
jgi:hypothetical protein